MDGEQLPLPDERIEIHGYKTFASSIGGPKLEKRSALTISAAPAHAPDATKQCTHRLSNLDDQLIVIRLARHLPTGDQTGSGGSPARTVRHARSQQATPAVHHQYAVQKCKARLTLYQNGCNVACCFVSLAPPKHRLQLSQW
jgi:hypothetical protein